MNIRLLPFILLIAFLANGNTFNVAEAGSSSVRNEIRASASTGGNRGTVETGNAEAKVFLETVVNGETVERVEERVVSEDGRPAEIHKESVYKSEEDTVQTKTEVRAQSDSSSQSPKEQVFKEIVKKSSSSILTLVYQLFILIYSIPWVIH